MIPSNAVRLAALFFVLCYCAHADGQQEQQPDYASRPASHYVEQLSDEDLEVRRRAAYILGRIDAPAEIAVPALAEALSDRQMEIRWYAIDALGQFGAEAAPAVPAIVKSLESTLNDETVRRRGARTLGRIGAAADEAVPTLQAALESDDALYRIAAADALWRIRREQEALSIITTELQASDAPTAFFAATTITELPDLAGTSVSPQLVAALRHPDADVRQAVVGALVSTGPAAIEPLSQFLTQSQTLGKVDAARALGMLIERQRANILYADVAEREFAAAAGPLIRTAFPALASNLSSDDETLRSACILALAKGGSVASFALLKALQSEEEPTRHAAAQALVRMEAYLPKQRPLPPHVATVHERIVAPLIDTLDTDDSLVQRAGIRLFVALQIGPAGADARPHLERALATGDLATRRFADKALKQFENQQ